MTMLKRLKLKANVIKVLALVPRIASASHPPWWDIIRMWTGKLLVVGFREKDLGVDDEIRAAVLKTFLAFA